MFLPSNEASVALPSCGMGFFSWDLAADKLYGDAVVAELFHVDSADLAAGLPILPLIERIAAEDRPRVAMSIHQAIKTGGLYSERYRVQNPKRGAIDVFAAGRCLKDSEGTPSVYNGTVIDVSSGIVSFCSDNLETLCQSALGLAEQRGNELAARYLSSALRVIGAG
jgi:hypothetical protein